jgi:A/G-specific adenine glycosylase
MQVKALETWFIQHQRDLAFRQTTDPYAIWVSEVMLQQTQVETMLPYYASFMKRFPHVESLAASQLDDILSVVQGIGYYRRFKLMQLAAQYIVETYKGVFPSDAKLIQQIPGIGAYTAGAILSIAFNKPHAATDGNVMRVLSRYYGKSEDLAVPKHRKMYNDMQQALVEQSTPRIFTQAVMELGALVCRPQNPKCQTCPLSSTCYAYQHQAVNQFPVISKKPKQKIIEFHTTFIQHKNQIWLVKNNSSLLHGMYMLPQEKQNQHPTSPLFVIEHNFTHQKWRMFVYQHHQPKDDLGQWIDIKQLDQYPIPIAHMKIIRKFLPVS